MRLTWFWRMLVYLVGGILTSGGAGASGGGAIAGEMFFCTDPNCTKLFMSRGGRDKHIRQKHRADSRVYCKHGCGKSYVGKGDSLKHHERTCDQNPNAAHVGGGVPQQHYRPAARDDRMRIVRSAHQNNYRLYRKTLNTNQNIYDQLRHVIMHDVCGILRRERSNVKFYVTGKFIFEKAHRPGVFTDPPVFFKTDPAATTRSRTIEDTLQGMYDNIAEQISSYIRNGSGWVLREMLDVDLCTATYDPTRASSYLQLPEKLRQSTSILNIRNTDDDKCALWCIIAHLFPKYMGNQRNRDGQQIHRTANLNAYKEHEHEINIKDIQFPLRIQDVDKLERLNHLAINIFSIDTKANIIPIRISDENVADERIIDLLYIVNGTNSHYCLITNLAGLCRPQATSNWQSKYLCRRCLHFCAREDSYKNHMERCSKHEPQKTVFPRKNDKEGKDKIRFTNIARQLPLPFHFIADFECILQTVDTCLPDEGHSSTTVLNKHVPCGAAYKISCIDPSFYRDPVIITQDSSDKSIAERFLDSILHDAREIRQMLAYKTPMLPLTQEEEDAFNSPDAICHICRKHIKADDVKCPDHCHITGKYRGPSHQSCNINYQIKPEKIQIPCFFHNLKNYDAHLLIAAAKPRHGPIKIVPTTTEKYISFTIGDVVFKDSYAFTQASLNSLTANLTLEQFVNTRKWLAHQEEKQNADSLGSDNEGLDEEEEEEDSSIDDLMFIDDRPIDQLQSGPSKRRYVFEDNDDDVNSNDDASISKQARENNNASTLPLNPFDDSDEEESDESDGDDDAYDTSEQHYTDDMPDFDYRRTLYARPCLTTEGEQSVEEDLNLLKHKGIYPYEYMDSFERFKECEIPPIEAFNSTLSGGGITEDEHAHAKKVFDHFEMKTLQEYHDLYLLQDIMLLDDVLTAFRKVCLDTYQLDPLHYHTAPGLTWDAGLKYTGITLELITDENQFLFVEAGIRGGISVISHRHAKANHPDLADVGCYDEGKPSNSLLYLDANNLYGYAMMQFLPISDFEWLSHIAINAITLQWLHSIKVDNDIGYIFEIDLHALEEIHEKCSNYPLAPERKSTLGHKLSRYQKDILGEQFLAEDDSLTDDQLEEKINAYVSTEKLILDLEPKKKYIVHYRTLQLYLKLGMKITHIHRVLQFKQKAWLAPYICKNTEMRQQATSEFEKDFFKLMNNAFFGKTMENVRKRRLINIVNTPKSLKKLVAQPTFKSITSFNNDLSAVERMKAKVMMTKPICVGLCVLELSKWLMYDFYYNILHQLFPQVRLLFTDTDSLCISISGCDNIYQRIREGFILLDNGQREPAINFFDLSAYPSNHVIFEGMDEDTVKRIKETNKKVPGKMKDELDGNVLLEFVGIRAKAYAFEKLILYPNTKNVEEKGDIIAVKKLKGIQKCVVKKSLTFNHYKSCLFEQLTHYATITSLRSHLHEIQTLSIRKVAMTPYDDKRYLLDDGISSIPYGHHTL